MTRVGKEEGEYEYASYEPKPSMGANIESATLVSSGEEGQASPQLQGGLLFRPEGGIGKSGGKHIVIICSESSKTAGRPCIRYVSFLGEVVGEIKHLAKGAAHAIVKAAHAVVHWIRTNYATYKDISCEINAFGAGVLVGVGSTTFTDGLGAVGGAALGSLTDRAVKYACDHS